MNILKPLSELYVILFVGQGTVINFQVATKSIEIEFYFIFKCKSNLITLLGFVLFVYYNKRVGQGLKRKPLANTHFNN